jgi:hypothetical protein
MREGKETTNDAFCMVRFTRINRSGPLFGTTVDFGGSAVELRISKATVQRKYSRDAYFEDKPFVIVHLSPSQFYALLTTMNHGNGTPGTLVQKDDEIYSMPPMPSKSEQFKKEIQGSLEEVCELAETARKISEKKTVGKGDIAKIQSILSQIRSGVIANLDFVNNQFQKQMAESVAEAKADIAAHLSAVVETTGIETIKNARLAIEQ